MNDFNLESLEEDQGVGSLARLAAGFLFLILGVISMVSAYAIAVTAELPRQLVLAFAAALISLACLVWGYRLAFNRPRHDGGLLSPSVLRLFALVNIGLPVASLASGAWRSTHIPLGFILIQAAIYSGWGFALWRLAARRQAKEKARL